VGDYLLSPDVIVERKAVPDLIQSLASGRLYSQAEAMCRAYRTPVVLVEFEPGRAFALTGGELGDDVEGRSPQARLALLLLHFPRLRCGVRGPGGRLWGAGARGTGAPLNVDVPSCLGGPFPPAGAPAPGEAHRLGRPLTPPMHPHCPPPPLSLVWSRSQEATGEVFLDLKRNRGEPDPAAAALVGLPLAHDGTPLVGAAAVAAAGGGVAAATYEAAAAAVASGAAAAAAATAAGAAPGSAAAAAAAAAAAPEAVVNQAGIELLRRLPGVTDANWRPLAEGVGSLAGLADAPLARLEALMGGARAARALHAFLHAPCPRLAGGPSGSPPGGGGGDEADEEAEEGQEQEAEAAGSGGAADAGAQGAPVAGGEAATAAAGEDEDEDPDW
jgi:ERCC4-type nuclease